MTIIPDSLEAPFTGFEETLKAVAEKKQMEPEALTGSLLAAATTLGKDPTAYLNDMADTASATGETLEKYLADHIVAARIGNIMPLEDFLVAYENVMQIFAVNRINVTIWAQIEELSANIGNESALKAYRQLTSIAAKHGNTPAQLIAYVLLPRIILIRTGQMLAANPTKNQRSEAQAKTAGAIAAVQQ